MTHIYDKNLNHIISLNYKTGTFMTNPNLYYPDWKKEYYASSIKFENPILDDGQIREMTREEQILFKGKTELLQDGEIIADGVIKKIEVPAGLIRASWDKEKQIWIETITKEELQEAKTNLILEHNKKRKEIVALNEESEYFDVSESVAKANDELEEIRTKINEIDKLIEEIGKQQ